MEDTRDVTDDQVIAFRLGRTLVQVWPRGRYIETRRNGTSTGTAPQNTDEYRTFARALGYGDDLWACCLEGALIRAVAANEGEAMNFQRKLNLCRSL